jgi:DegV family protein with EDD domain
MLDELGVLIEPAALSPSPQTAIVCDSTTYLPPELIEAHGIEVISLYVTLDGESRRETEITDLPAFYDELRAAESAAATSQPSVGDFIAAYEPLLAAGRDVVSIHISAGISGTVQAAGQAKDRLEAEAKGGERIRIYDSGTSAGGLGLCVLAAAEAAGAGAGADETLARAVEMREGTKLWFAVDTLEYLRRGGRIGGARAWIGSTLKIKPILTLEDEITPIERVRTRARSIERLCDYASQRHDSRADAWVVQHIQDPESAASLAEDCRKIFGCEPVFLSEIGPVLGAHAGPGLLGVGSTYRWR